jgi:mannose-1-phosphate guanylyltransferase
VNAIVLAAGLGTRLGSAGRRLPKVLVDVGGRPLLAWHLERLERQGFTRVVVNAHHLADRIQSFVDGYRGALDLRAVVEPKLLGTAGGVRNALPMLEPGPFVVLYGDVVTLDPLAPLLETHTRRRPAATIAIHESPGSAEKGLVEVDDEGWVTEFVEKGVPSPGPALVNSGIYVLDASFVEPLPLGVPLDFGYDVLPDAVERRTRIAAHRLANPVIDVGTPEALAQARSLLSAAAEKPRA